MDTLEMNYEGKLVRNGKPVDFDETTTEERKKVFVNELMRIELKLHYLTFINHSAYGVDGVSDDMLSALTSVKTVINKHELDPYKCSWGS